MQIIRADKTHKQEVLKLLDSFRTACGSIIDPEKNFISTTAKELGNELKRVHGFYEKAGFNLYGRAYDKQIG
jgi:hypothetical protein